MEQPDERDVMHALRRSPRIFERLRAAGGSELRLQAELRREFPEAVVRMALSLWELRRRGAAKFTRAAEMWFDRKGLEQATAEAVARHKARRFQGLVWDYCCGIGSDAIAQAEHADVIAVDVNPANCLRTRWNAEVYGVARDLEVVCADVTQLTSRDGLVHVDPDRRPGSGGRVIRLEDYVPGLEFLARLTREFAGGAIKVSPASNFGGKFPHAEIELISLDGECKEATVWFGELAGDAPFRATALPAGETLAGNPLDALTELAPLGRFLYDPDPAIVRAGLVDLLAVRLGLHRLDDAEEYLTSDQLVQSPFVQAFEVLAELPNNDREIRGYFRTHNFGSAEIKCRHIPIQAEAVRRRLPLHGSEPGVLVFARIAGRARAVICRRLRQNDTNCRV